MDDEGSIVKSNNQDVQIREDTDSTLDEKKAHSKHKTNGNLTTTTKEISMLQSSSVITNNLIEVVNDDESRQSSLTATSDSCDLVIDSRPPSKLNGEIYPEKRKTDETLKNEFEPMSKQIKISNSPSPENETRQETINDNILDQSIDSGKSSLADLSVPEMHSIVENTNEEFIQKDGHLSVSSHDYHETKVTIKQTPLKLIFKRDGQNNLTISSPNKTKFRNSPTPSSSDYSESSEDEQFKQDISTTVNNVKIDENKLETESKFSVKKSEEIKCIAPNTSTDLSNVQSLNTTPDLRNENMYSKTSNLVAIENHNNRDVEKKLTLAEEESDIPRTVITDVSVNNYCLDREIINIEEIDAKNNFSSSSILQYLNYSTEQQFPKPVLEQPAPISDYPLNLKMQSVDGISKSTQPKPIVGNNMRLAELLSRPRKINYPHESVKDDIDLDPPDYLSQHQSTSPLNLQMPKIQLTTENWTSGRTVASKLDETLLTPALTSLTYPQLYPIVPQYNQVNNQSWNVQQREKRQIIPTFKIRKETLTKMSPSKPTVNKSRQKKADWTTVNFPLYLPNDNMQNIFNNPLHKPPAKDSAVPNPSLIPFLAKQGKRPPQQTRDKTLKTLLTEKNDYMKNDLDQNKEIPQEPSFSCLAGNSALQPMLSEQSVNKPNNTSLVININNIKESNSNTNSSSSSSTGTKRKVLRCGTCVKEFEPWDLFVHMRELHDKFMCLYCYGVFPNALKLIKHLLKKHNIGPRTYASIEEYGNCVSHSEQFMLCVDCEQVFDVKSYMSNDPLIIHYCTLKHPPLTSNPKKKPIATNTTAGNLVSTTTLSTLSNLLSSNPNHKTDNLNFNNNVNNITSGAVMSKHNNTSNLTLNNHNNSSFEAINSCNEMHEMPSSSSTLAQNSPILTMHLMRPQAHPPAMLFDSPAEMLPSIIQEQDQEMPTNVVQEQSFVSLVKENYVPVTIEDPKPVIPKIIFRKNLDSDRLSDYTVIQSPSQSSSPNISLNSVGCESSTPSRPLIPKLKLKLPLDYHPPPMMEESEESATESDDNEVPTISENPNNGNEIDENREKQLVIEPDPEPTEPEEPDDGIPVASEDCQLFQLTLDEPLDKINIQEFLKLCLKQTIPFCPHCNYARRIALNGKALALHMIAMHRFDARVNSITEEELQPKTIVKRLKIALDELTETHFNLETYDSSWTQELKSVTYPKQFECFQCRFITNEYKKLYLHNRQSHQKSIFICIMCKANLYSYSELICHLCPGVPNQTSILDYKFRCCLCDNDSIQSAFRLMVHIRKRHNGCDICLEQFENQRKLSEHVWKHKLNHFCYRCSIPYRNKDLINNHLFWKHGVESVVCKKCLGKKWPHSYHFCQSSDKGFFCEFCNMHFMKAKSLKVHKRLHTGENLYPCPEENCEKQFISRKLLARHLDRHNAPEPALLPPCSQTPPPIKEKSPEKQVISEKECAVKNEVETPSKRSKKKKKDDDKPKLVDIMDLPAPNLSESDSSDESDNERPSKSASLFSNDFNDLNLSQSDNDDEDDHVEKPKPADISNIWENFKSYQAQNQSRKSIQEEDLDEPPMITPILHVSQSDHDYCAMYVRILPESQKPKQPIVITEDDFESAIDKLVTPAPLKPIKPPAPPKPVDKNARFIRSGDTESESSSSSGSDSSCECGSNCSCSSSSSSGSSSSSADSDNSSYKSISAKRKQSPKKRRKKDEKVKNKKGNVKQKSPLPLPEPIDPDTIINESDLETDESDTDEDFYDEHPQKIASQLLDEKRKQMLVQTGLDNSRATTPSIPEEIAIEAGLSPKKSKKRKRDRKSAKSRLAHEHSSTCASWRPLPPLNLNIPIVPSLQMYHQDVYSAPPYQMQQLLAPELNSLPPIQSAPPQIKMRLPPTPRLSTGNSSESDAPLKRSQRNRKPNKFYGYTSDEESKNLAMLNASASKTLENPFAPPNLTWDKDDLPSPPKSKANRSKSISGTPSSMPEDANSFPPIPPVIIRPNQITKIEPLKISNLPLTHAQQSTAQNDQISDTYSSGDEGGLQIALKRPPPIPKLKMSSLAKKLKLHVGRRTSTPRKRPPRPKVPKVTPTPPTTPISVQPQNQYYHQQPLAIIPETPKVAPLGSFPEVRFNNFVGSQVRVPTGWRAPMEGEKVYCYCNCAYDEVSQMIGCDGDDCKIEWFHFECVGILMAPKGKWYCPECRPKYIYQIQAEAAREDEESQSQEEEEHFNLHGQSYLEGY